MAVSKLRFLCVVGAKLRTEVTAVRCPPKFNVPIAGMKRPITEGAKGRSPSHQISAANDHQIPPVVKGTVQILRRHLFNDSLTEPAVSAGETGCWQSTQS